MCILPFDVCENEKRTHPSFNIDVFNFGAYGDIRGQATSLGELESLILSHIHGFQKINVVKHTTKTVGIVGNHVLQKSATQKQVDIPDS